MKLLFQIVLFALRLGVAIGLAVFAWDWRSPIFASIRMPALAAFIAVALALIAFEIWKLRRQRARIKTIASAAVLLVAGGAFALTLFHEATFQWQRHDVLQADAARLEYVGRHLIVGYRDPAELQTLVQHRAIAGIFITAHNVRGKTSDAIRREIASLQSLRRSQGLPPLLIATDQEGGTISRMSPPLPRQASLGDIVRTTTDETARRDAVRAYATETGRGLADLGFNLNFAPVVDLNHHIVNAGDRYTRIYQRAISDDPQVVTAVARDYCAALMATGVHCTLKHFPGLGRVVEDTHLNNADLTNPVATLEQSDWLPFRAMMNEPGILTMLGHARLTAIDPTTPASFSRIVISELLRGEWSHEGVLVTDDFNMSPAYSSEGGIGEAAVRALNAGVDLILVSYDGDQVYPVLQALLAADDEARLDRQQLALSEQRLARLRLKPGPVAPGGG